MSDGLPGDDITPAGGASVLSAGIGAWLPIETAPKDGAYVLVSNGYGVWVARFKDVYQSGWKPPCPWQSMMLNHDHIPSKQSKGKPTHWMPLPEAPNAPHEGPGAASSRTVPLDAVVGRHG